MIPFGPWHPDQASIGSNHVLEAKGVLPSEIGFAPLPAPEAVTPALDSDCRGAVSVLLDDGTVETIAGTADDLYRFDSNASWEEISSSSGAYSVPLGEQWQFAIYGNLLIATNFTDGPQKIDVTSPTAFAALGGSPPVAKFVDVVKEFMVLGHIASNEKRVQWSANGNAESWTPGTGESDYQDFPNGGPIRGIVGGDQMYVMQANRVTRGTYVPGSDVIFQFEEVEGANGLAAPYSLVRLRNDAFYLSQDGIRRLGLASATSAPIGARKWLKWFMADKNPSLDAAVFGAASPIQPLIIWAYVSKANAFATPDRMLIYDWSLDEATFADYSPQAMMRWLSPGVTLDGLDGYGTMETLEFSLDSPFWRGGYAVLGVFSSDNRLNLFAGSNTQAQIITADGMQGRRHLIKGVRPYVDNANATAAVAVRERDGDAVSFGTDEAQNDQGICPQHVSGNIARARLIVPAGETWTAIKGLETLATPQGAR